VSSRDATFLSGDAQARLGDIVGAREVTRQPRELAAVGASSEGVPTFLVRPGTASEIAEVVRLAAKLGAVVLPVGTASRRPRTSSRPRILLDIKRLDHVTFLDETSLVVQVQAGATGLGLEELLRPRGLTLGDFPPAVLGSTVGGMLSVRTPGKSSPRHGFLEDAVLGVSAVLADGRTLHTRVAPRRATGPDLGRVLLGSEGSLGIMTGCVLRIHRRPETRLLDAHRLPDFAAAVTAAAAALRSDAKPAALRLFDPAEAAAYLGEEIAPGAAVLCVATAGPSELATVDREIFASFAQQHGGTPLGPGPAEIWWKRRFGQGSQTTAPSLEITAPLHRLPIVHAAIQAAAVGAGRRARAHASRLDEWSGCLFVTLLDGERPDPAGPARAAVTQAAHAAGADLVGVRDADFLPYLAALKARLDPAGIFGDPS
jgi:alkyldihydroxyacetonephosphate synthase